MNVWNDASKEICHCRITAVLIGSNTGRMVVLQNISERAKGRLGSGRLRMCRRTFLFNIGTFHVSSAQVTSSFFILILFFSASVITAGVDDNERDCISAVNNSNSFIIKATNKL